MADLEITEETLARIHPFALALIVHFDELEGDRDHQLEDEHQSEIRLALSELYRDEELRFAVTSLLNLAATLQEEGSPIASRQLFDLLAEKPLLDALDQLNIERHESKSEETAKVSDKFKEFTDSSGEKCAPKEGEDAPEGAIKLDKLNFPKRL